MMFMGIFLLFSEFLSRKGSLIRPGRGFFWFSNALFFAIPKNFFAVLKILS